MTLSYPTTNISRNNLMISAVILPFTLWLLIKFLYYAILVWIGMEPIRKNPWPYILQQLQILYNFTRLCVLTGTLPVMMLCFFAQKYPQLQPRMLVETLAPNASMAYGMLLLMVFWTIRLLVITVLLYAYSWSAWMTWQLVVLKRRVKTAPKRNK